MSVRTKISSGIGRYEQVEAPPGVPNSKCYRTQKGCTIIVSMDPALRAPDGIWLPPASLMLWHLSVAHRRRYPTWDEIADARYELVPEDVTMALILPPPDEYVNLNEHCFHLWQIEDRRVDLP